MVTFSSESARAFVRRFPWPGGLREARERPNVCLLYRGVDGEKNPVYECTLSAGALKVYLRHPSAEGALRFAILEFLHAHARGGGTLPSAAALKEMSRLAN